MKERILGNEALLSRLRRVASYDHVANAYILSGPEGSGKRLIADAFQEMLQVSPADRIDVVHEKPNIISVDDIRNGINRSASVLPYESSRKLYVVDEAEKMNVQAQNALLKTLEEPPEYVVILLLTENEEAFLPTILSRAVRLRTAVIPEETIQELLLSKGFSEEESRTAARLSGGAPGRALEIVSSEDYQALVEEILKVAALPEGPDPDQAMAFAKTMAERKADAGDVISLFRLFYRDVLVLKSGGKVEQLFFGKEKAAIQKIAAKTSFEGIGRILQGLDGLLARLKANVNTELSFESFAGLVRDEIQKEK